MLATATLGTTDASLGLVLVRGLVLYLGLELSKPSRGLIIDPVDAVELVLFVLSRVLLVPRERPVVEEAMPWKARA